MLSSPVWRGTPAAAFCAGLLLGGMVTAAVLLVAGSLLRAPLPEPARWAVLAAGWTAVLLRQAGGLSFPLPENRRLVPQSVFRFGRHLGPLQFGIEMGTGARTYLPSGLPYVAALAVLLLADPVGAVAAGLGFGVGRALMTTSSLRFGPDGGWNDQWRSHRRVLALLTGGGFAVAVGTLFVAGLG